MKTRNQLISQIKRLVTDGTNGMVWVNFIATNQNGKNYISGHNMYGSPLTLCSDGRIFMDECSYKAGLFKVKGHKIDIKTFKPIYFEDYISCDYVKFFNNTEDMSTPPPSANVSKLIAEFEITELHEDLKKEIIN